MSDSSRKAIEELIGAHRRRLHELEKRRAFQGISVDPAVVIEIEMINNKIFELTNRIAEIESGRKNRKPPAAVDENANLQSKVNIRGTPAVPPSSRYKQADETSMEVKSDPPIVFISFSHDSDEHRMKVAGLGASLITSGCDCRIDLFKNTDEDWPTWMSNQLLSADVLLCVTTETYHKRFRGIELAEVGKGVGYEAPLIRNLMFDNKFRNIRIFPVFFNPSDKKFIPLELKGFDFFELTGRAGYERLLRKIFDRPEFVKPEIGDLPELPRTDVPPMF